MFFILNVLERCDATEFLLVFRKINLLFVFFFFLNQQKCLHKMDLTGIWVHLFGSLWLNSFSGQSEGHFTVKAKNKEAVKDLLYRHSLSQQVEQTSSKQYNDI